MSKRATLDSERKRHFGRSGVTVRFGDASRLLDRSAHSVSQRKPHEKVEFPRSLSFVHARVRREARAIAGATDFLERDTSAKRKTEEGSFNSNGVLATYTRTHARTHSRTAPRRSRGENDVRDRRPE